MYSRPKIVVQARCRLGLAAPERSRLSTPGEVSWYRLPSASKTISVGSRSVLMNVFRPLIEGTPPTMGNCETRPGRVRTPPGKKATSASAGDIPVGTSDGSSSVTQVLNVLRGNGEKVSMLMV